MRKVCTSLPAATFLRLANMAAKLLAAWLKSTLLVSALALALPVGILIMSRGRGPLAHASGEGAPHW